MGTLFKLADVVKPDLARKRKVLSSAHALKNLERCFTSCPGISKTHDRP